MAVPLTSAPATVTPTVETEQAVATLVVAFAADPIVRWFLPDAARYVTHFPQVLRLMGEAAFTGGTADLADGAAGAALWVPPGGTVDEEGFAELLQAAIDPARHEDVFAFMGQMGEHHPTEPHWYLPFIGVDPTHQGQGHGSALLERGLARCDRDGLPAYLEASSPRNRALYERHGLQAFAEIQVADSPPLWPMSWNPS